MKALSTQVQIEMDRNGGVHKQTLANECPHTSQPRLRRATGANRGLLCVTSIPVFWSREVRVLQALP